MKKIKALIIVSITLLLGLGISTCFIEDNSYTPTSSNEVSIAIGV